jgi:hypothetical protein
MTNSILPWQRQRTTTSHDHDLKDLTSCGELLAREMHSRPGLRLHDWLISALLKIRTRDGRLQRLSANRAQREFSRAAGRRNIILKARQMGITTWIAARFFIATITQRGMLTVLVAHDQASAESIFGIVHRFWENLPERLRAGALRTSRANVRQLVFPLLDSEYRVESAADAEAGRGLTIQNLHCSEVARWPGDAAATLASLRASLTPKGEVVLESTPRGAVGCFYNEWQRAADTGYTPHFYPWWWEDKYREELQRPLADLTTEERELKTQHGLDDSQIAYRRQMFAGMQKIARQEYAEDAETCFLRSGECVFEIEAIEQRLAECADQNGESKMLEIFLPPQRGREYIIGVDPAGGGVDGDYSCAQVIDRLDGWQCAELHAHLPPQELAAKVARLARDYNNALVAVERNNQGGEVLSCLWNVEKFANIYKDGSGEGFNTTWRTRSEIVAALGNAFHAAAESFQSDLLLREMRTFVRRKDGSGAAAAGAYDDAVMAMGIALRVRELTGGRDGRRAENFRKQEFLISIREMDADVS